MFRDRNVLRNGGCCLVLALCICFSINLASALPVNSDAALTVGRTFLASEHERILNNPDLRPPAFYLNGILQSPSISAVTGILDEENLLIAHILDLDPEGFIIVSPDTDITPILGYSYSGHFAAEDSALNPLIGLVSADIAMRRRVLAEARSSEIDNIVSSNVLLWSTTLSGDTRAVDTKAVVVEQWPPDQEGWLNTFWSQAGHFNDQCPIRVPFVPFLGRVVVGCVATAMSQIINYWQYPSSVSFSDLIRKDGGDAYTSGGAILGIRTNINIFGDSSSRDFPTAIELTDALSFINYNGDPVEEAYLSFAAGIKLEMQYGSSSGTDHNRVPNVFKKQFAYGSAKRSSITWPARKGDVIENMKAGWPAMLGIASSSRFGGHSVIVDGYKIDDVFGDMFHVNFGWGNNNSTTWYDIPDFSSQGFDLVLDVIYDIAPYVSWSQFGADAQNSARTPYVLPSSGFVAENGRNVLDDRVHGLVITTGGDLFVTKGTNAFMVIDEEGTTLVNRTVTNETGGQSLTSPVSNSVGVIYFASSSGKVYRIKRPYSTDPELIFTEPSGAQFLQLKIDEGGFLYAKTATRLYRLNSSGQEVWASPFIAPGGHGSALLSSTPAIDLARGYVYVGYFNGSSNTAILGAINVATGQQAFLKEFPGVSVNDIGTPSVASDGTVYVGMGVELWKLTPGTISFTNQLPRDLGPAFIKNAPAIGKDGTLYVSYLALGVCCPPGDAVFAALDPDTLQTKWAATEGFTFGSQLSFVQPYVGSNDIVVFEIYSGDSPNKTANLFAYRDLGNTFERAWNYSVAENDLANIAIAPGAVYLSLPTRGVILRLTDENPAGAFANYLDNAPPDIAFSPSPAIGAVDIDTTITLSWIATDPDAHALTFDLFLGDPGVSEGLLPADAFGGLIPPIATALTNDSFAVTGLERNTTYLWSVTTTDGQSTTEGPTWTFTTQANNLPSASAVTLSPASPFDSGNLNATYTYSDPDGDPESGTQIRWFRNSVPQSAFDDLSTVPASATSPGDEWFFTVRPSDGMDFGDTVSSDTVLVIAEPQSGGGGGGGCTVGGDGSHDSTLPLLLLICTVYLFRRRYNHID